MLSSMFALSSKAQLMETAGGIAVRPYSGSSSTVPTRLQAPAVMGSAGSVRRTAAEIRQSEDGGAGGGGGGDRGRGGGSGCGGSGGGG